MHNGTTRQSTRVIIREYAAEIDSFVNQLNLVFSKLEVKFTSMPARIYSDYISDIVSDKSFFVGDVVVVK